MRLAFLGGLAAGLFAAGCNQLADGVFCADDSCEWSDQEWERIRALSPLPDPPPDPSNRYADNPKAVSLGWKLYWDPDLSGPATLVDMLGRPVPHARAERGMPIRVSCATCHDPRRGGGDVTSFPDHVSVGAGWYDVNGQQTVNAAHYKLLYWNGRSDSLWGQAAAVMESPVSMNGDRLSILYTVATKYAAEAAAAFADSPLPLIASREDTRALLARPETETGPCAAGPPCAVGCRTLSVPAPSGAACWPQFPLHGRPGAMPGCQPESTSEPYGDAFDCMADEDRAKVTVSFVNVAKAIGAYERKLTSRRSAFDEMVAEGPGSKKLEPAARRGLKLFVGRASCIDCHNTPLFSDNNFHNIGVPQTGPGIPTEAECRAPPCDCVAGSGCLPWGFADGLAKLQKSPYRRDRTPLSDDAGGAWAAAGYQRMYQMEVEPRHRGTWRTPSLRDSALTGPYMHNGIFRTLEQVIWHYDQGGDRADSGTKAVELQPLFLSARDRTDLLAFLRSLTGRPDCPEAMSPPGAVVPACL